MSSGWPPEEDEHRWEPVGHASVVGAGHDSRGAERGYSGYARYTPDADESGGFGPYGMPPSYDEVGWYASVETPGPADASHPSGPLPGTHGGPGPLPGTHGGTGGADLYGAPVYMEAGYRGAGPEGGQYEAAQLGDAPYEAAPHGAAEYGAAEYGGAQRGEDEYGAARHGETHYAGAPYRQEQYAEDGYEEGYAEKQYADDGYGPSEPDGSHPGLPVGYQAGGYESHEPAGYGQIGDATGPGHQQASYAGYREPGYHDAGRDSRGYQPAAPGQQDFSQQDYGYQDYGDPRYDDPSYGDLAYDDTPYPGSAHRGTTQAGPSYPDEGFQDTGYGGQGHASGGYPGQPGPGTGYEAPGYADGGSPGYADGEYGSYPDAGASAGRQLDGGHRDAPGHDGAEGYEEDAGHEFAPAAAGGPPYAGDGYRPGPGFPDGPGPGFPDAAPGSGHGPYGGPGDMPGYVAAEYASGQFPPGIGAIGQLSAGMPDPAATGMLDATGILDSTGISDSVELYGYHPGAAEATRGFLDAPTTVGTLDATGIDPSGFLDDPALGDRGIVLDGAEAGDATGVLEGGSGFFDDADLAETTSVHLPAEALSRDGQTGGTGALLRPRPGSRPVGRRRGRSGDRRLWFALGGVVIAFVGALVAIVMVAFPSGPGGPAHTMVTPNQLNAFTRRPALEQQMNVAQLRQDVVNTSSGQARHVVEGVYEAGNSTSGTTPQIILFIGGNLLNASPKVSVASFTQRFRGARITSAGGPGEAACVNATASEPGSVAICAWFDNDSFGEVVSPTMSASALANTMRQIRPHVELVVKQKQ